MSVTLFGIVYILVAMRAFFASFQALAFVFIFSYLFQVSSVFNADGIGVCPYLISPMLLIIKGFSLDFIIKEKKIFLWGIFFLSFVVVQSIVATSLFYGIPVMAEGGGMESNLAQGCKPLSFGMRNIYQWVYLFLNMGGCTILVGRRDLLNPIFMQKTLAIIMFFVLFFGLWRFLSLNAGFWFPSDFFFSNTSINLVNLNQQLFGVKRFTSIFVEASICGLYLAVLFWNLMIVKIKRKRIYMILCLIGILLTMSSTGFFLIAVGGLIFLFITRNVRIALTVIGMFTVVIACIYMSSYAGNVYDMTFNKMQSDSADIRIAVIDYCINLFVMTSGLGCGLGSSIGSNILTTLLSQIGVIGTAMYLCVLKQYWSFFKRNNIQISFFPVVLVVIGQVMSVGYLSFPLFWMQLALSCSARPEELESFKKD